MNDLDTLRPEVREAVQELDGKAYPGSWTHEHWLTIRAELLRLARNNVALRSKCNVIISGSTQHLGRAEKAEAELAAVRARISQGIILDVDDLARGHAGLPSEWRGKHVRLVVEE